MPHSTNVRGLGAASAERSNKPRRGSVLAAAEAHHADGAQAVARVHWPRARAVRAGWLRRATTCARNRIAAPPIAAPGTPPRSASGIASQRAPRGRAPSTPARRQRDQGRQRRARECEHVPVARQAVLRIDEQAAARAAAARARRTPASRAAADAGCSHMSSTQQRHDRHQQDERVQAHPASAKARTRTRASRRRRRAARACARRTMPITCTRRGPTMASARGGASSPATFARCCARRAGFHARSASTRTRATPAAA